VITILLKGMAWLLPMPRRLERLGIALRLYAEPSGGRAGRAAAPGPGPGEEGPGSAGQGGR